MSTSVIKKQNFVIVKCGQIGGTGGKTFNSTSHQIAFTNRGVNTNYRLVNMELSNPKAIATSTKYPNGWLVHCVNESGGSVVLEGLLASGQSTQLTLYFTNTQDTVTPPVTATINTSSISGWLTYIKGLYSASENIP